MSRQCESHELVPFRVANYSILATVACVYVVTLVQSDRDNLKSLSHTFDAMVGSSQLLLLSPLLLIAAVLIGRSSSMSQLVRPADQLNAFISFAVLVIAASIQTPLSGSSGLWAGFGLHATLASVSISSSVLVQPIDTSTLLKNRVWRSLLFYAIPLGLVLPRLLLFVQPPNGLINLGDTTYHVLDELLAPMTGGFPYANYTPQYTGALGWILLPLNLLPLSSSHLMTAIVLLCNLFNLSIPLLVVAIVRAVDPRLPRTVLLCAFVALWTVCGSDLGYSVQIREFAHFARYLIPLLALLITVRSLRRKADGSRARNSYLAGSALGAAALNGADFGLSLAIAILIAFLIMSKRDRTLLNHVAKILFGFALCVLGYATVLKSLGESLNLGSYVGLRSSALSGNIYDSDFSLDLLGPHLLLLCLPVILISIGLIQTTESLASVLPQEAQLLGLIVGLWTLALLLKFLVFPTAVAVPAYVVPAFIGISSLLGVIQSLVSSRSRIGTRLVALPLLFIVSLSVGAVYPTANVDVSDELQRISGTVVNRNDWSSTPARPVDGWTREALSKESNFLVVLEELRADLERNGVEVGYFGPFGGTVELVLGIDNLVGIAAPESMRFGEDQVRLACYPVAKSSAKAVIAFASDFPCSGFRIDSARSPSEFSIYLRQPTMTSKTDGPSSFFVR